MDFSVINSATMMIMIVVGQFFSGILILAYTARHERSKALNTFLISKLLQTAAWILISHRTNMPGMIINASSNALLFTGVTLEQIAFLILKDSFTQKNKKIYLSLLAAGFLAYSAAAAFGLTENMKISIASCVMALLMAFPVYRLFTGKHASLLQRLIAASFSVTALTLLFRGVTSITSGLNLSLSSSNAFNAWLYVVLYLHMVTGSMGFILLDKERLEAELVKAATLDGLTNALNRQTFEKRSAELISLFSRKQEPVSCLLLDIDNFKQVNDQHGHLMGDAILRGFASTIRNTLRNDDLFGRYGGEEFSVLLPGADKDQALVSAERLRAAVEAQTMEGRPDIRYTVSIGVSTLMPDRETTTEQFYRLCDKALYMAKSHGKNQVRAA